MATRRNAPCPCGSGKKYKHCCGAEGKPDIPPAAARLGSLMRHCTSELQDYASREYGAEGIATAWEEFGRLGRGELQSRIRPEAIIDCWKVLERPKGMSAAGGLCTGQEGRR